MNGTAQFVFFTVATLVCLTPLVSMAKKCSSGPANTGDDSCIGRGGKCVSKEECKDELDDPDNLGTLHCPNGQLCCQRVESTDCRTQGGRCGGEDEFRNIENFGTLNCPEGEICCDFVFGPPATTKKPRKSQ